MLQIVWLTAVVTFGFYIVCVQLHRIIDLLEILNERHKS